MNNDLKKLSRLELLEILLEQSKRIEELEEQVNILNTEINSKKIEINEIGSLAEASLKVTEIFKSADEAANIYINNVKEKSKEEEKKIKKECLEMKRSTKEFNTATEALKYAEYLAKLPEGELSMYEKMVELKGEYTWFGSKKNWISTPVYVIDIMRNN